MRPLAAALLLAVPLLAGAAPTRATPLDSNLIVNGDAEAGTTAPTGFEVVPIPGWSRVDNMTAVSWATGGGFPVNSDPGPVVRGNAFFAGGPASASSELTQVIDVSDLAGAIDAGSLGFRLAGYLGGFASQEDHAVLQVTFRDGAAATLGSAAIGPVSALERGSLTGMLLRAQQGALPAGTRTVEVRLLCTRLAGSYNDGYADSLAFVLSSGSVGVGDATARALEFAPVFPNPVRDGARFAFRLPAAAPVRLEVLDVNGRRVAVIAEGSFAGGEHAFAWHPGSGARPGVYFARLEAGSHVMRRRFVVLD